MKNHLIIILITGCFLFSCGKKTDPELLPELFAAEEVMWDNPERALFILDSMDIPSDKYQHATWCLLKTQAEDKNYITHTSDSLINIALKYFEHSNDLRRKAMAFFMLARYIINYIIQNRQLIII